LLLTTPFVILNQEKEDGSKIKTRQMRHFGIASGWRRMKQGEKKVKKKLLVCKNASQKRRRKFFPLFIGEKL
jgi:hypothetical protein